MKADWEYLVSGDFNSCCGLHDMWRIGGIEYSLPVRVENTLHIHSAKKKEYFSYFSLSPLVCLFFFSLSSSTKALLETLCNCHVFEQTTKTWTQTELESAFCHKICNVIWHISNDLLLKTPISWLISTKY